MRPRLGFRNLVSMLKHVVLPAPLGPIRACMDPRRTFRSTPLTAEKPPTAVVRPSVTRIYSPVVAAASVASIVRALLRRGRIEFPPGQNRVESLLAEVQANCTTNLRRLRAT